MMATSTTSFMDLLRFFAQILNSPGPLLDLSHNLASFSSTIYRLFQRFLLHDTDSIARLLTILHDFGTLPHDYQDSSARLSELFGPLLHDYQDHCTTLRLYCTTPWHDSIARLCTTSGLYCTILRLPASTRTIGFFTD